MNRCLWPPRLRRLSILSRHRWSNIMVPRTLIAALPLTICVAGTSSAGLRALSCVSLGLSLLGYSYLETSCGNCRVDTAPHTRVGVVSELLGVVSTTEEHLRSRITMPRAGGTEKLGGLVDLEDAARLLVQARLWTAADLDAWRNAVVLRGKVLSGQGEVTLTAVVEATHQLARSLQRLDSRAPNDGRVQAPGAPSPSGRDLKVI